MIGKMIGHYKILEELGRGGMGVVYRARDSKLNREVALKFLPSDLAGSDSDKARFRREAQAAAALNHPNVCVIYEIEESGEHPYIAMEFIDGMTLREKLAAGTLETSTAIDYAVQIAEALQAAHAREIIHRDIKSDNIMITPDNRVKVTDFGLAKLRGAAKLTRTSSTMGTLAYMPPEHIQGGEVDARADIFSFGVVLYEMLAGQLPFQGEYESALMYAILNEEPEPLQRYRADISSELLHVVNRALEKSPDERYQSIKDMLIDLRRLKRDTDRVSRDSAAYRAAVGKGGPSRKRVRSYWIGGGIAVAVVIVAAVLGIQHFKGGGQAIDSVAVLPFESISEGALDEYMVDGIMGDLISSLSKIDDLKVTARASAMRFKDTDKTLKEIAAELGVNTVIAGEVRQVGDRIRIYVELIHAATERSLWSENYDRDMRDIENLLNDISLNVVRQAGIELSQDEKRRFAKSRDVDPRAYEKVLEARHYWYKFTEDGLRKALALFNEAIDIDPLYAQAYAYVALVNCDLSYNYRAESREALVRAKAASQRAFELDDTLAETYLALGWVKFVIDWDLVGVESYLRRAVELKPHDVDIILYLAPYLSVTGRHEEALELFERAVVLDPLTPMLRTMLGKGYYAAGLLDQAIAEYKKACDMDPTSEFPHGSLAWAYANIGMHDEAIAMCDSALILAGDSPSYALLGLCGYVCARAGRRDETLALLDKLMVQSEEDYCDPMTIAVIYTALDDKDKAFEWLERCYEVRCRGMTDMLYRTFISLRSDPRYQDLLRRMGVPEDWENLWYDRQNDRTL